ncbi:MULTISPECIES: hypothetical protein [unclassified Microcoleus]|nr:MULTISPECIES: hypothetical protein [unclassified Microcoleus]
MKILIDTNIVLDLLLVELYTKMTAQKTSPQKSAKRKTKGEN